MKLYMGCLVLEVFAGHTVKGQVHKVNIYDSKEIHFPKETHISI